MKVYRYIIVVIFLLVFPNDSCKSPSNTNNPPNIIILLVDDAGYADFGFMGSKDLKTPNLDRLAANGMIFTDAHVSASVCGPSRAGLITGKYQQRFGYECNPETTGIGLPTSEVTLAEALKSTGYKTGAFGKWHLGDLPEMRPNQQGFDYSYGFLAGGRSYFSNKREDIQGNIRSVRENDKFASFDGYLTDVLADKAVQFIDTNINKPFFMYWSPNAVHTPMEATEHDLAMFEDHPRQTLAAMTWALDRAVGTIVDKLKTEGILENTLIFFLSDNGGAHNNLSSNLPLKGFKGNKFEGGHRVAFVAHWPRKIKAGSLCDGLTSSLDIFATSLDAAGIEMKDESVLDGVSLIPYFNGKGDRHPHKKLFWRKDRMAASRYGSNKLISVDSLGDRLYNLENDLGETQNLKTNDTLLLNNMKSMLNQWEQELVQPIWIEAKVWNQITWMIHEDLYNNADLRVRNPKQLVKWKLKQNDSL